MWIVSIFLFEFPKIKMVIRTFPVITRLSHLSERSQNALKIRPAPGKTGAIWVMEVWLQLFWIQLPQLNSFLPHPKYKSLCDWSTQNVHYDLPSLSTGVSYLPFPSLQRIKHVVFWNVPHRIERIRPNLYLSIDDTRVKTNSPPKKKKKENERHSSTWVWNGLGSVK